MNEGGDKQPKRRTTVFYRTGLLNHSSVMADKSQVIEERVEFMVPPSGGSACLRKAYFLKPSVTSINGPAAAPSPTSSATLLGEFKDMPLKVNYCGWWKRHPDTWKTWVHRMHSLHNSTWRKSGILEAVVTSTCHIHRYNELIWGLVEKWCPNTNSFVFPWGEATVTLEDMAVLGGYSVLGESVLFPIGDAEGEEILRKLVKSRSGIIKSKSKNACQGKWMSQFMGRGSEIEHEAFLAYWLSRFVFLCRRNTIGRSVLPIAVHLARGTRIALAPAALAPIYKSLSHLKASIIAAKRSGGENDVIEVTVSAQLGLVQVWIWERFQSLRPNPRSIGENEARLMRWHDLKLKSDYRPLAFDSAGEDFVWRPYLNREKENEFGCEGMVRWLRASELVSLEENCIEQYLPHRVAMQFGLDQDIPGHVARLNVNPEIAFRDYNRPISDVKLCIPPRVSEGCVTSRYLKWWKKLNHGWSQDSQNPFVMKLEDDYLPPPPGFCSKWKRAEEGHSPADNNGGEGSWKSSKGTDCNESVAEHCEERHRADNNGGEGSCKSSKNDGEVIGSSDYSESVAEQVKPPPSSSHSSSRIEKHVCSSGNDDHLSSNAGNIGEETLIVESEGKEIEEKMRIISNAGNVGEEMLIVESKGEETEEKMRIISNAGNVGEEMLLFESKGKEIEEKTRIISNAGSVGEEMLLFESKGKEIEEKTRIISNAGSVGEEMLLFESKGKEIEEKTRIISNAGSVGEEMLPFESKEKEIEERMRIIEKLCDLIESGKLNAKMKERKQRIS